MLLLLARVSRKFNTKSIIGESLVAIVQRFYFVGPRIIGYKSRLLTLFAKQATSMRRSTVLILPLQ
jgi:hypothetical protein